MRIISAVHVTYSSYSSCVGLEASMLGTAAHRVNSQDRAGRARWRQVWWTHFAVVQSIVSCGSSLKQGMASQLDHALGRVCRESSALRGPK